MLRGLDVDEVMTNQAPLLKAAGFDFILRYLKNVAAAEVAALHRAGLIVGFIWETTATRALDGAAAGAEDGQKALAMMQSLGAPATCAIYATVDNDIGAGDDTDIAAVEDYFAAFDSVLWGNGDPPNYPIGGYADGTVLGALRDHGLPFMWLAGAMGWDGSRDFEVDNHPHLVQGPTISGGSWHGQQWPDVGFQYDPDLALIEEFGGWAPPAAA